MRRQPASAASTTPSGDEPAAVPVVGRRERHKLATRERLLESAVQLFATQGYDETSIDDIAEAADVARATVFNYFSRKTEFVLEWVARRRTHAAAILSAAHAEGASTAAILTATVAELAKVYTEDAKVSRPMVRVWLRAGGPLLPGASATAELFAETIELGQARGDIDPTIDPVVAGRVLLDAYLGVLYRWSTHERGAPKLADSLSAIVGVIIDGIGRTRADRS